MSPVVAVRFVSFISSVIVGVSFFFPWFKVPSGESYSFWGILSQSIEGSFSWLNPSSATSLGLYVVFFTGILMVFLGVLFGLLGGRSGPALGILGLAVFTAVSWHVYGSGFGKILGVGYLLALAGFALGIVFAGGEYL